MMNYYTNNTRITSIDALRAFALLGILITHTIQLFNFSNSYNDLSFLSSHSTTFFNYLIFLFSGRFRIIFSILFGVSFYLILRNPHYTSKKFLWRLTLLIAFGLFNKLFYTTEILMWYGLCGMLLIVFRGLPIKHLILWFVIFYVSFILLKSFDITIIDFPKTNYTVRYQISRMLINIVSYGLLNSIYDYISMAFPNGIFETLSYFLFGYILGESRVIYKLDKYICLKNIIFCVVIYIILLFLYRRKYDVSLKCINEFIGAILYSSIFIYFYNRNPRLFKAFENYGKCGLTNYTLQNIFGVVIVYYIVFPYKLDGIYILLIMSLLYVCQVLLSNLWMNRHTYGPLEYIWRRFTNLVN